MESSNKITTITSLECRVSEANNNFNQSQDILIQLRKLNDKLVGQSNRTCGETKEPEKQRAGVLNELEFITASEQKILIEIQQEIDNLFKLI